MNDLVILTALEWWNLRPRSQRTRAVLEEIIAHYADLYAVPPDQWVAHAEEAWRRLPAWRKEEVGR